MSKRRHVTNDLHRTLLRIGFREEQREEATIVGFRYRHKDSYDLVMEGYLNTWPGGTPGVGDVTHKNYNCKLENKATIAYFYTRTGTRLGRAGFNSMVSEFKKVIQYQTAERERKKLQMTEEQTKGEYALKCLKAIAPTPVTSIERSIEI